MQKILLIYMFNLMCRLTFYFYFFNIIIIFKGYKHVFLIKFII